ncbi:MAG: hypothetical protein ABH849_04980 [Nanoarchaeota archaeon]
MGMSQKMVMQVFYIGIVIIVMGSLAIFMKSNIGNESFERDFLAKDFGMLESTALIVNNGLKVEMDMENSAGIYSFEQLQKCEVKFFQGAFDSKQQNIYFCFSDSNKQMNIAAAKFGDVEKLRIEIQQDNVFFDADENI